MKKIFGIIISLFALLSPALVSAQCGTCPEQHELGKGPGEKYFGDVISGYVNYRLSPGANAKVPVMISLSDGSSVGISAVSTFYGYGPLLEASKCIKSDQYIEVTLTWSPGYYAMISGTWVPGHYNVSGWGVKHIT